MWFLAYLYTCDVIPGVIVGIWCDSWRNCRYMCFTDLPELSHYFQPFISKFAFSLPAFLTLSFSTSSFIYGVLHSSCPLSHFSSSSLLVSLPPSYLPWASPSFLLHQYCLVLPFIPFFYCLVLSVILFLLSCSSYLLSSLLCTLFLPPM